MHARTHVQLASFAVARTPTRGKNVRAYVLCCVVCVGVSVRARREGEREREREMPTLLIDQTLAAACAR